MPDHEFVVRATANARTDAASLSTDNRPISRPDAGVTEQITITVLPNGIAIVQPACEDVLQPILTYQEMTFRRNGSDQVSRVHVTVSAYSVKGDRLLMPLGCVPRVKQCLEQRGYAVTILDRRASDAHFELETASRVAQTGGRFPGLAAILRTRREGIIEVETGRQRSEMIAAMCQLSPRSKFLIACRTIDAAQELAENLRPYLDTEVEAVHGHNWWYSCRVVCCTFESLDRSDPHDWDVLVFADAFDGIQKKNHLVRAEYTHRRVYAFVDPRQPRSNSDELQFEEFAGEVIYRDSRSRQSQRGNLSVAFATHSTADCPEQDRPRERRMSLWSDEHRNRAIAELATTLSTGAASFDGNLVLNLTGNESLPALGSDPGVIVFVDSVEHGEQLQRSLPSWRLYDGRPSSAERRNAETRGVPRNSIVTAAAASTFHSFGSRIVIWASGGARPFIPQYFDRLPSRCLLIDFWDDGNAQQAEETQGRLRFYHSINCRILGNDFVHQERRLEQRIASRHSDSRRNTSRRPRRSNRSQFNSRKKGE